MQGQRAHADIPSRAALEKWVLACASAVIYYALARAGSYYGLGPANASALWPAAGFALAAVLLWGPAAAAGVLAGAWLADERQFAALSGASPAAALAVSAFISLGRAAQALLGAALLRRLGSPEEMARRTRDAAVFCLLAPLIAMISPGCDLLALALSGMPEGRSAALSGLTWWIGNTLGLLVVAPLVLAWARPRRKTPLPGLPRAAEGLAAAALLAGCAAAGLWEIPGAPLLFVTFPPMFWILIRFGPRAATAAVAMLAAFVTRLTLQNPLPLSSYYLAALSITALIARALLSEREAALIAVSKDNRDERDRRIYEHLPTGIMILRLEETGGAEALRIVDMNPAGRRLVGAASEPLRDIPLSKFAPEVAATGMLEMCLGVLKSGESRVLREYLSAQRVPGARFDVTIFALSDKEIGMTFDNSSEHKRTRRPQQDGAAPASSNAELAQFASIASHDLSAPLHKVKAFAERLQEKLAGKLDDEGSDYMKRMLRAVDGMQSLIASLMELARVTTHGGAAEVVDLGALAKDVVEGLDLAVVSAKARVEIGALPRINADPLQMRQLLQNLIANALKFHRPGIHPEVRVRGKTTGDGFCELTVSDNGIGFEMKHAERIFQPFQRLNGRFEYEGSGMGLAICRKIAARHGGTICATSKPGHGAEFKVVMPISQEGRMECRPLEKASK